MARFTGKGGGITVGGSNIAFTEWSIDHSGETVDVTGMDSAGIKSFLATLTEWSGTAKGFCTGDPSSWAPGATLAGAVVFASSGTAGAPKLTSAAGGVIPTGLKISTSVGGAVEADISFQGSGTLTYGTV